MSAIALLAVCVVASVVLLVLGLRLAGRAVFSENDAFEIERLAVLTHGQLISDAFVRACIPVEEGTNLFAVNIGEIRDDFMARAPSVDRMYISRRMPGTLEVEVWERVPIAWVAGSKRFVAIDRAGYVFPFTSTTKELPSFRGVEEERVELGERLNGVVEDAVTLVEICEIPELSQVFRLASVDVAPARQLREDAVRFELTTGEQIDFWWNRDPDRGKRPEADLRERLEYLRDSLLEFDRQGKRVATMDLTFDTYPDYCPATLRQG